MDQLRALVASGILLLCAGCKSDRMVPELAGGVRFALPRWPEKGRQVTPGAAVIERADGRGNRAQLSWDVDARTGPPELEVARAAAGLEGAQRGRTLRAGGHEALELVAPSGSAIIWRCDKTARLLRLVVEGSAAPSLEKLAEEIHCHAGAAGNGEVPTAASAALGAGWRFAHRGRGSAAYLHEGAVLTFFAGQLLPMPRDAEAARRAAPAWAQAAGLAGAVAANTQPSEGPQGHPALRVQGIAKLDGAPMRWTLLVWRCIQRQRTFAALVFARAPEAASSADFTGHDGALISARCHGGS
jgi:hypothetical protein